MGWSHDVTLPIDQRPEWPQICIRCGERSPTSTFSIRGSRIGWDQILTLGWAIGSRPLIEAPACPECAAALRRERCLSGITSWLMCIPLIALGMWVAHMLGLLHGPLRKWYAMGAALLFCAPILIWELLNPRTFDVTVRHGKIDYEFKDRMYAASFAIANNTTMW